MLDEPRNIVLVTLSAGFSPAAIPLGAACLASALKAAPGCAGRYAVSLLEARLGETAQALAARIAAQAPFAVGFSLYCWNAALLSAAAGALSALKPGLPCFAGGPEVTGAPEALAASGPFHILLAGEAEGAIEDLLAALDARAGPQSGGNAKGPTTIIRAREPESASLPSPWLDGTLKPLKKGAVLWELERGCPYACAFCFESKGSRRVRRLDRGRIERELELFARSGVAEAAVLSPTFNADRDRALDLLNLFRKKGRGMVFSFEVRAEALDARQAKAFAAIGAKLQVGLQSARPEVCARVGRSLDREDFKRKIALLDKEGLIWGLDLIYGLPGDDLSGFRSSLDWALALRPNHLDVFRLSILPGTRLHDEAAAGGMSWESLPPYRLISSSGFPPADLEAAESLALSAELFYNRGRSVAWFLPLCRALGLAPTALLDAVSARLEAHPLRSRLTAISELGEFDSAALIDFQQEVLASLCVGKKAALLPLARDLAALHGAYGRAMAEGLSTEIDLAYDPEESLSSQAEDLRAFASRARPSPRRVRVAPDGQGDAGIEDI